MELLVTMILLAIFMAGVVYLITQGYTFFGTQRSASALNREGARSLDKVENLLRGLQAIDNLGTSATQVTFQADVDGNSANGTETLVFSRSGSQALLSVDGSSSTLTGALDASATLPLEITYYTDYEMATPVTNSYNESVRAIKVVLRMTKSSSGVSLKRTYSRSVMLILTPDDRKDYPPA